MLQLLGLLELDEMVLLLWLLLDSELTLLLEMLDEDKLESVELDSVEVLSVEVEELLSVLVELLDKVDVLDELSVLLLTLEL